VERGELGTALDGDLMRKEDSGGMFVSEDRDEAQRRMDAWEISPTGPMFGTKMRAPEREAERIERELWAEHGVPDATLERLRGLAEGTRRVARIRPQDPLLEQCEGGVSLAFGLPKGAYATVILRELLKPEAGS
jgi:tRNA pseudouridine13 synthase